MADAFHPDVWEWAAEQTHEVAIGDASTSGQRSRGRARDDFGGARVGERLRPAGRSQPEQFRMLVQAVLGDRGDVEAQRARGADRGNGTLHGQASSQRGCGDEPRFVSVCGRPACVGELRCSRSAARRGRSERQNQGQGRQSNAGTVEWHCMHTFINITAGLAERGTRLTLPAALAACGTGSVTSAFA